MKVILITIMLLYSNHTISSELITLVDKKLSQGCVAPVLIGNNVVLADKNGTLYSFDADKPIVLNWKLYLSHKEKIGNMSLSQNKEILFFIVNNVLYVIDAKTGKVKWERELRAPVRGKSVVINNRLVVLTIDDYLYMFDIKDGSSVWTYQNSVNVVRGLYSISPTISNNKIIAPFSNGELIAFNEKGKKLWSQKLATNLLDSQIIDVTTTPRVIGNILVATNSSYIYGIDIRSGNILWSKSIQVKSMSDITSSYSSLLEEKQWSGSRIFVITIDNKVIGIDIHNGETAWVSDLYTKNTQLFATIMYANTLWVTSNKRVIFAFHKSEDTWKAIKIPGNVFHTPVFTNGRVYVTTDGNGVFSLENRFIYD